MQPWERSKVPGGGRKRAGGLRLLVLGGAVPWECGVTRALPGRAASLVTCRLSIEVSERSAEGFSGSRCIGKNRFYLGGVREAPESGERKCAAPFTGSWQPARGGGRGRIRDTPKET